MMARFYIWIGMLGGSNFSAIEYSHMNKEFIYLFLIAIFEQTLYRRLST